MCFASSISDASFPSHCGVEHDRSWSQYLHGEEGSPSERRWGMVYDPDVTTVGL